MEYCNKNRSFRGRIARLAALEPKKKATELLPCNCCKQTMKKASNRTSCRNVSWISNSTQVSNHSSSRSLRSKSLSSSNPFSTTDTWKTRRRRIHHRPIASPETNRAPPRMTSEPKGTLASYRRPIFLQAPRASLKLGAHMASQRRKSPQPAATRLQRLFRHRSTPRKALN